MASNVKQNVDLFNKYGRPLTVFLIIIVGILLTVYALNSIHQENNQQRTEERIQAAGMVANISSSLSTDVNSFNYLANYFGAGAGEAIGRFSEYAINFLDENNSFQILMYAPKVTPDQVQTYLEGINPLGYAKTIAEYQENGQYKEALVSDQSFPIDLIENFSRDEIPFGTDLISNQDWINDLYAARDSGQPVVIQVPFKGKSLYWVVRALYSKNNSITGDITGYLIGSIDFNESLNSIFKEEDINDFIIQIDDPVLTEIPDNHILDKSQSNQGDVIDYAFDSLPFGGKRIDVIVKGSGLNNSIWTLEYALILALGILLTAILCIVFWLITARAQRFQGFYTDLRESQEQLVQNEKMASLGQMVASIAHEINTPLGYIGNNVALIHGHMDYVQEIFDVIESFYKDSLLTKDEIFDRLKGLVEKYREEEYNEMQSECMELLVDSKNGLNDISEMVMSLKDFSRIDRQQTEECDLRDGLTSTLKIASQVISSNEITVKTLLQDIPTIKCSPSKINQVFLNIITNGCQAMEPGGTLIISTQSTDSEVSVIFTDNGSGMDKETQQKMFDPFYSTKDVGEGTGLGMSISYKIIEEHNGRIDVDSKVGVGTKMSIILPINTNQAEED